MPAERPRLEAEPIPTGFDRYSFWVHLGMATMVGCTMIAMGIFLSWRVMSARELVRSVQESLAEHREYIMTRDATVKIAISKLKGEHDAEVKTILDNQQVILDHIRREDAARKP